MTAGDYIALGILGVSASGCAFVAGQGGWVERWTESNVITFKRWWPGPVICLIVSLAFTAGGIVYCAWVF